MPDIRLHTGESNQGASLPIKITLIVFWILMITGALVAVAVMKHIEQDLKSEFANESLMVTGEVTAAINEKGPLNKNALKNYLGAATNSSNIIDAITLKLDSKPALIDGVINGQMASQIVKINYLDKKKRIRAAELVLYHNNFDDLLAKKRKNLLISMGASFIIFGILLAALLKRIIARPFSNMVDAAKKFSDGNQEVRFNTKQSDEFGYLSRFFNKILDQLLSQQDDLRGALKRIKASEVELSKEKERIEVTLYSIGDAVVTTDKSGKIDYLNPTAERFLGISANKAEGLRIEDVAKLIDEYSHRPIDNPVADCLANNVIIEKSDNVMLTNKNDQRVAISFSVAPINDRSGRVIGAVMVLRDVEQTRQLSRQLSYQASHDELTGLYNRRTFEEQLKAALDAATLSESQHAFCYMDLDQFKIVNDTCGHVAGDKLLRQLADVISSRVRDSDMLARLGGDEFGILLKHCDIKQAEIVSADLQRIIRNFRFSWDDYIFETGVSIGLVEINSDTQSLGQLLSSADMACYAAKEKGRNRIHVYQADDDELNRRRGEMQWVSRIKEALEKDRFQLYHQPIAQVDDIDSGEIHFEVLLRMLDNNDKIVPPMTFIPAAERYHLMPSIDRWVISNTLRFLRHNMRSSDQYTCSINLSGQSLGDDSFHEFIVTRLKKEKINPENICFEITETAAITNLGKAKRFMDRMKQMGCKFSLDDFGSGVSSFSYLKDLPVDFLKIDGTFIKDMIDNPVDYAMVEAVNRIGHVMRLKTIAEFVENDEILKQLKLLGINYAQGYGIAKPSPIEDLLSRLDGNAKPVLVASKKE